MTTHIYNQPDQLLAQLYPRYNFYEGKSVTSIGIYRALKSQVHAASHILCGKTGIGSKYMFRLMFWVGNKVLATGQASGTCLASYFGWDSRYLQVARAQVYLGLYILG